MKEQSMTPFVFPFSLAVGCRKRNKWGAGRLKRTEMRQGNGSDDKQKQGEAQMKKAAV